MRIQAIDPGTFKSATVLYDSKKKEIVKFEITENYNLPIYFAANIYVIEMVASYGMPVGKEVFDTVLFIGRLVERINTVNKDCKLVYRKDIKMHLCGSMKAKDSNIRQALIDKLGGPGTKKNPGKTYGISKDLWSALAIAVYYEEVYKNEQNNIP